MNSEKRHLMFLKKDGAGIVVEATNSSNWEEIKQEAESKGMTCLSLSLSLIHI